MPILQMESRILISRIGALSLPLHLQHTLGGSKHRPLLLKEQRQTQRNQITAEIRVSGLLIIIPQICRARYHFLAHSLLPPP